jgi:hypothetical protein
VEKHVEGLFAALISRDLPVIAGERSFPSDTILRHDVSFVAGVRWAIALFRGFPGEPQVVPAWVALARLVGFGGKYKGFRLKMATTKQPSAHQEELI